MTIRKLNPFNAYGDNHHSSISVLLQLNPVYLLHDSSILPLNGEYSKFGSAHIQRCDTFWNARFSSSERFNLRRIKSANLVN